MRDLLESLRDEAIRRGVDFMDVRAVDIAGTFIQLQDGRADRAGQYQEQGLGVRVLLDRAWGFASTDGYDRDRARDCLDTALAMARASHECVGEMTRFYLWLLCALFISTECGKTDQEKAREQKTGPAVEKRFGVDLPETRERSVLSQKEVAKLAAELANEECSKMFWGRTPFSPDDYPAVATDSRWHWGKHDSAGLRHSGFSAEVRFDEDGSEPEVEVLLHTDER